MLFRTGLAFAGLLVVAQSANAEVFCRAVGIPKGCVVRLGPDAGAPGVGVAPGAGAGAPGVGVAPGPERVRPESALHRELAQARLAPVSRLKPGVNRGGPVDRPGRR